MNKPTLWRLTTVAILASVLGIALAADLDKPATDTQLRALVPEIASLRGQPAGQIRAKELKVFPVAPTGFTVTTTSVTNSTPVAIPTAVAVVTSTILISGAGPYLWDVDLTTFLTHSFPGDLDITITSPAGTVVTLTTDNGGGNAGVFNGTVWDDQANPGGQVPYVHNNGIVTDHEYLPGFLAPTLTPEEPLGAFRGQNPNGTWTITISDDNAADGGTLNSWTLDVHTLPSPPIETSVAFTQSTPTAIPSGPAVVTSTLLVSGMGNSITSVDLTTFLTHSFPADIDMTIMSPGGTVVTLTTDNATTNDDVFNGTNWNDKANPAGQVPYASNNGMVTDHSYVLGTAVLSLTPEEPLSAFLGQDPNGTWTITISDDAVGDGGTLTSWSLNVTTGVSSADAPPVFNYSPAPTNTIPFTGGTVIGSTGTGTITVSVGTAGTGTGPAATTTTSCTPPTIPFTGFGQSVTATGSGAISGGPLSGTCVLGATLLTQTLTCSENRGGTLVARTFELSCPAGTVVPLTSSPTSGSTIFLPVQTVGNPPTMSSVTFTNAGLVGATVTCVAPAATQFTVFPLVFPVPAGGSAATTISFNSGTAGTFNGVLNCTADNQSLTFNLVGTAIVPVPVPMLGDSLLQWLVLASLLIGILAYTHRRLPD